MLDARRDLRSTECEFIRHQLWVTLIVVALAIVSRNPGLLGDLTAGIGLKPAIGDVITLGPVAILALTGWACWEAGRVREAREDVFEFGAMRGRQRRHWRHWLVLPLFLVPALGVLFLFRQYVLEVKTQGAQECGDFGPLRLFYDWALMRGKGFVVEYCFGNGGKPARSIYIYPPVQTWLYLAIAIWSAWLGYRSWRHFTFVPTASSKVAVTATDPSAAPSTSGTSDDSPS
ncbi:hypothetical protein EAH89_14625 [Roseomonas nepalensis]|uniref:Uncharacterized protein n=2 Tax=Muricoccus nepalensis TaxID=1854500 RepID=A0A502G394_9PROT|nr:hypothetical protein EAH89_14625 [Roseomonas nepalensis]